MLEGWRHPMVMVRVLVTVSKAVVCALTRDHRAKDCDDRVMPAECGAGAGSGIFNVNPWRSAARAQSRCQPVNSTNSSRIRDFPARSARAYAAAFARVTACR